MFFLSCLVAVFKTISLAAGTSSYIIRRYNTSVSIIDLVSQVLLVNLYTESPLSEKKTSTYKNFKLKKQNFIEFLFKMLLLCFNL